MIAAALAALLALAATASESAPADGAVTLPIELTNNHVYLEATIDGKGPYHLVFDSGSPFDLLDRTVAAELGLRVRERGTVAGVGDREARAGSTRVPEVRLGTLALRDRPFVVTDLHATLAAAEGRPLDGVIGRDVLARFVTSFDYAAGTVTLGARFDDDVRADAVVVPMRLHGGIPQIACTVAGVAGRCNVDTGSRLPLTVPGPFAAAHPGIVPTRLSAAGIDGYGLGGAAYGRLGRLASLEFGGFALPDEICDFSTQARGAFADRAVAANIGGGVLRRFVVTFDYAHERIALRPGAAFDAPGDFDRSGLFATGDASGIRVIDVRPGTAAAAAGLAPEDRIVALDGRRIGAGDLVALRARLAAPAGTLAFLRVERAGVARDVALVLRDYAGVAVSASPSAASR